MNVFSTLLRNQRVAVASLVAVLGFVSCSYGEENGNPCDMEAELLSCMADLASTDPVARENAMRGIRELGDKARPALVSQLQRTDEPAVRDRLETLLAELNWPEPGHLVGGVQMIQDQFRGYLQPYLVAGSQGLEVCRDGAQRVPMPKERHQRDPRQTFQ